MMNRRMVNIIKALAYLLAFFIIITMVTSLIFAVNLFTGSNSQMEMQSIYKDDKIINNLDISLIFFLNIIVSTILDIELIVIKRPNDTVKAIVPILGLIIIIMPDIIAIKEHINIESQVSYSYFLSSKESLKSKVALVTITIPATIGNKVFIISGLSNITTPSNNSIIPSVKKLEKNKLVSFSIIK